MVFALDLRAIALFRIGIAFLMLLDLAIRAPDIAVFYTSTGVTPVDCFAKTHWIAHWLELYKQFDTAPGVALLFLIQAALCLCLMGGCYSRTSALLCWYLNASLQNRNVFLIDGGDVYLRTVLLCASFLPLGARWSWDARRNPQWARLPNRYRSVASAAVLVQIGTMYCTAGLLKTDPCWRVTGDAVYLSLSIDQFTTAFGRWLLQFPGWLRVVNFAVLTLETTLPLLLLFPYKNDWTRTLAAVLLAFFHLGVASSLHLGLFMPICLVTLVLLLPTPVWDRLAPQPAGDDDGPAGPPPPGWRLSRPAQALLVSIAIFIPLQNGLTVVPTSPLMQMYSVKQGVINYGRATGLMQNWSLFAPRPFAEDGWFAVEATTREGKVIDLLRGGQPPSADKPADVAAQFPNQRWRRYFQNLWQRFSPQHVPLYLNWLRERWNAHHTGPEEVKTLRLIFYEEPTQLPGIPSVARPFELGRYPSDWLYR